MMSIKARLEAPRMAALGLPLLAASHLAAQNCVPQWDPVPGVPGPNSDVLGLDTASIGGEELLFAGGPFTMIGTDAFSFIASWDGEVWSPVGSGVNDHVLVLRDWDDGDGPALYAGGVFTRAGDAPARRIARWDGQTWSALGAGVNSFVSAIMPVGDGPDSVLFVGGKFTSAGGISVNAVAQWDGESWSAVGQGVAGGARAIADFAIFDDGAGPAVFAGGDFTITAQGAANNVAVFRNGEWAPVGGGLNGLVRTLAVFDDGAGPVLVAGGDFTAALSGSVVGLAQWDGVAWTPFAGGVTGAVRDLQVVETDQGPALVVAGAFAPPGVDALRIAMRRNGSWLSLGDADRTVEALAATTASSEPAVFAGGEFLTIGGQQAERIARYLTCAAVDASPADLNQDGFVDGADLGLLLLAWGEGGGTADLDGSGRVDGADLGRLLLAWSPQPG